MYKFYYDYVKPMWPGDRSSLIMTDTDNFMMDIKTDDFYEAIKNGKVKVQKEQFDFSNYDKDHHSGPGKCE